jgi:hypothetical protein
MVIRINADDWEDETQATEALAQLDREFVILGEWGWLGGW